ncbi:hypothetical protein FB446DRAFT_223647 [Lentinula raphanica]|nr:hypothetical protein FB446DRAFT_223647 [Lentinula raphanica]
MECPKGLLRLPDNIIAEILKYSLSYATLFNTILASKAINRVFRAHPRSILHVVNYTEIGPSFPLSLRRLRYKAPVLDHENANSLLAQAVSSDVVSDPPMTMEERKEIRGMEDKVMQLENLFSFRYLDRRSVTSKFTPDESWRFRRALHRITLYTLEFPLSRYPYVEEKDRGTMNELHQQVAQEKQRRVTFLSGLGAEEMLEISAVLFFLEELGIYVFSHTSLYRHGLRALLVAAGPEVMLACHYTMSDIPLLERIPDLERMASYHPLLEWYIWGPLLKILQDREIKADADSDDFPWSFISNRITEANAHCHRCKDHLLFDVWTQTTWTPLALQYRRAGRAVRAYSTIDMILSLKERLNHNGFEHRYLRKFIEEYPGDDYLTKILNDIYDCGLKLEAYASWTKDDLLCEDCFDEFLREHLHIWLRYHINLTEGGSLENSRKDCEYGYRCDFQGDYNTKPKKPSLDDLIQEHQKTFNHLCAPTRQDPQNSRLVIEEYCLANERTLNDLEI